MKRCLLSQQAISFGTVMSVWGLFMCDQQMAFGMWLHAVGCICSSVSYLCDSGSRFLQNIGTAF